MAASAHARLAELIVRDESRLLNDWMESQSAAGKRSRFQPESQLRDDSAQFLSVFSSALRAGAPPDTADYTWTSLRRKLEEIAKSRAQLGLTPMETATFVFSLKEPIFALLRRELQTDLEALADLTWAVSILLDKFALLTMSTYMESREQIILRQQQEMLELSTPVVKLWESVLALPLIGTLDSARTQVVMQNLLEAIVAQAATIAIIDITGVPTVDTLVAQHLLKTVAAARLMGADCIISGIRPQIAQTIIHLGVDLAGVTTKATLADAIKLAFRRLNYSIVTNAKPQPAGT